ncbi:hypothetical protein C6I20_11520 [Aeromicrobium sp. A1-2]|uniref:universal stress protein n=1 Tax=Aeromicrobium sp. A1-2 TaxID=2107713 RepID=UPI000E552994|nr:universal stress protein [Aeromicrobium sp. A1-2]AXT85755.1 hypothetical protein C6I20_11520 [Aeromicrobium sp. A1-2]
MTATLEHLQSRHAVMVIGIVQGRPYAGALAYALERALVDRAQIRVVSVGPDGSRPNIPLDAVVEQGDPVEVLSRRTAEADILVVQSSADSAAGVADIVMARLRADLSCLLIEVDGDGEIIRASGPAGPHQTRAVATPRPQPQEGRGTVTVGVDGSVTSDAAVAWATEFALVVGASVQIVSAYPHTSASSHWSRSDATQAVADAAEIAGVPVVQTRVMAGEPVDVLLTASLDSNLLVVGRHGTQGIVHSALGAVGDACARLATCPVVVVP